MTRSSTNLRVEVLPHARVSIATLLPGCLLLSVEVAELLLDRFHILRLPPGVFLRNSYRPAVEAKSIRVSKRKVRQGR